jgi:hypothetical protein
MGRLILFIGPLVVAGILLWVRDRFRDFRNISAETRKLAERKTEEAAMSFLFGFYFLGCIDRATEITAFWLRICYVSLSVLFLWSCVRRFQNYRAIHASEKVEDTHRPLGAD